MAIVDISLKGKVALITGGSRGIGEAIAMAFAEQGADVAISARKLPDLEAVAKKIEALGRKSLPVASHIGKPEEIKSLVEQVKAKFGHIDILVNNAGTNPYNGPLLDAEEWAWDVTNNVNLKGPFLLSLAVARLMKEQGGGNIINIASSAGLSPSNLHIYSITKAGVIMMTRVMARELAAFHIRVNAIAPGVVKTRLAEALWKNVQDTSRIPVPEDIAGTAVYLASNASKLVNGETIMVAGGGGFRE
jgi:NAD(P)-dependent dehydrogenase (short-subunit alcohol dehydrogenase family)